MRRSRLLTALLSGAGRTEIEGLGAAAGWPIPESAAAAACAPDDAAPLARRLGAPVLSGTFGDVGCLVIADPDAPGAGRLLAAAAADLPLTIGPTVAPAAVADSWAEAERAHAARIAGMLPGPGLLRTGEHLAGLILAAEPALVERLARCRLEPLSGETDASRSRLTATLRTWLAEQGAIGSTAAILGVHPQTVRYRMARLRELFGPDLDDADARFELQLALRATRA
ncbi:MAG: helix-turn-helix domain-containing protein [Solirubrobacterales bacterium]